MRIIIIFLLFSFGLYGQGIEPTSFQPTPYEGGVLRGIIPYEDPFTGDTLYIYQHDSLAVASADSIYISNDTIFLRDGSGFVDASNFGGGTVTSVGLTTGATGTDINITNSPITTSGNLNINIPTASAANRGALSSADWTTFNGKVGGTGVANKVAFWNSANTLSQNTNFHWDNVNSRLGVRTATPLHTLDLGPFANANIKAARINFNNAGTYAMYYNNSTLLNFDINNRNVMRWQNIGNIGVSQMNEQYSLGITAAIFPAYSFLNDQNTGLYRENVAAVGLSAGTLRRFAVVGNTNAPTISGTNTNSAFLFDYPTTRADSEASSNYLSTAANGKIISKSIDGIDRVTGSGVANRIAFWNAAKNITNDAKLDYNNQIFSITNKSTVTDSIYQRWIYSPLLPNAYQLQLKQTVTSGNVRYNFSQINNNTTYNDVLVFDRGNVGIGTTNTAAKLHVNGDARITNTTGTATMGLGRDANGKLVDLGFLPTNSSGTVTSIAIANGGGLTVSGSPITTSGTITLTNTRSLSKSGNTVSLLNGGGSFNFSNNTPATNNVLQWNGSNWTAAAVPAPQTFIDWSSTEVASWFSTGTFNSGKRVGLGILNPTRQLDANGDVRLRGAIYNSVNSSGSAGQVLTSQGAGAWTWTTPAGAAAQNLSYGFKSGNSIPLNISSGIGVNIDQGNGIVIDRTSSNVITVNNSMIAAELFNTGNVLGQTYDFTFRNVPFASGSSNGITISSGNNANFTVNVTGTYEITYSLQWQTNNTPHPATTYFEVFNNGISLGYRSQTRSRNFTTSSDNITNISRTFTVALNAGTTVDLRYQRQLGTATQINLYNANLTIKRLY